jgi:hypothetical protein
LKPRELVFSLAHLADHEGCDFGLALWRAKSHYQHTTPPLTPVKVTARSLSESTLKGRHYEMYPGAGGPAPLVLGL